MPGQLRWELDDAADAQPALFARAERHIGRGEFRGMEFFHVRARSIINELKSGPAFLPFQHTINAYRGCSHACTYCFARPTHDYLGLGIGEDFERRIVVKINAVDVLRAELSPRRWAGHPIAMGTNTDPYQRCEGKYRLTQGIVQALMEVENPFSVLTKSTLVLRDLDLLREAARCADVRVDLSIGTLDEDVWRATEPGTPNPRRRVRAVEALNEAGIPSGVLIGPIIPGLSDGEEQLEEVVKAVVDAGAVSVGSVLLHLRPGVREHYLAQLGSQRPDLLERYRELYPEGRAYAPAAERKRVGGMVHRLVRRHGGPHAVRLTSDRDPEAERPVERPRRQRAEAAHQLGLDL
jgi:DNA repair photolyase